MQTLLQLATNNHKVTLLDLGFSAWPFGTFHYANWMSKERKYIRINQPLRKPKTV